MKKNYDFSKSKKNPYANRLKQRTTIRIDKEVIQYFQSISNNLDIPYQTLINLYLRDCMESHRVPNFKWKKTS
jgi:uncharacterized protein (DUF4415 family)